MITPETTIKEIRSILQDNLFSQLIYDLSERGAGRFSDESRTLKDIQAADPAWNADDMVFGLNTLCRNAARGRVLYDVYRSDETAACPGKANVKLVHFPAETACNYEKDCVRRTLILASGGAYGAVCNLPEAFPAAAEAAALGIDCLCLTYRVGALAPLFPKPMEDLAAAIRFLFSNEQNLDVSMKHYAVGGFSAGGHLAACGGIKELGYRKFNLPAPEAVLLAYPLLNVWKALEQLPEPYRKLMLKGLLGSGVDESYCGPYNVDQNIDCDYPPCFIVHARDDETVDCELSSAFARALTTADVPCVIEKPEHGGHGFGRGGKTEAEGWIKRAITFWKEQRHETVSFTRKS